MKELAIELGLVIQKYQDLLNSVSEQEFSKPQQPGKWTKKQELGHLIDSAHNNLRRFIVSQYENEPNITYNQDEWVMASNYQNTSSADLVALWSLINKQIAGVLLNMLPANEEKLCNTGKEQPELRTLKWLATDYIRHMKHHLHHILDLEPVSY